MLLIIAAWIPQTIKIARTKRSSMPKTFSAVYSLASILLTMYAISIGDLIFTALNAMAFAQSFVNLKYAENP